MTQGLIVVVDAEYSPLFPVYRTLRTCEAAIELLEQVAVAELWIRGDLEDAVGVLSLIEFLEAEDPWEGRSQIGTVVVFSEDNAETELERRLQGRYPLRRVLLTKDLFAK